MMPSVIANKVLESTGLSRFVPNPPVDVPSIVAEVQDKLNAGLALNTEATRVRLDKIAVDLTESMNAKFVAESAALSKQITESFASADAIALRNIDVLQAAVQQGAEAICILQLSNAILSGKIAALLGTPQLSSTMVKGPTIEELLGSKALIDSNIMVLEAQVKALIFRVEELNGSFNEISFIVTAFIERVSSSEAVLVVAEAAGSTIL